MASQEELCPAVSLRIENGVGLMILDRPHDLNTLSNEMLDAIVAGAAQLEADDAVRVVVLTGEGRAFSAGADMGRLERIIEGGSKEYDLPRPGVEVPPLAGLPGPPERSTHYNFPMAMSKPVIAAINGPVVGASLVLAASCDILFMSETAFISAAFGARGLVAESALAWLLAQSVGTANANDILLSGRRIGAQEAMRMGFVSQVMPHDELRNSTLAYAQDMARQIAPRSLRIMKRQVLDAPSLSYEEAALQSYDLLMEAIDHPDFREGVASFLEKRDPDFTGR